MKTSEIKKKYLEFFKSKNHIIIPSASLVPEHDPTVLFTTAGMHPLVPFLIGQPHPSGKRLANIQKCLRTQDIDEVGDEVHTTLFEMIGNWGLGDYWKKQAIEYTFEFYTKQLWLDKSKLAITCFKGDKDAPKASDVAKIWMDLGIPKERIAFLPKSDNWWGPAGETGPCGTCTEIFYWKAKSKPPKKYNPKDKNWVEIGNNVFMEYNKTKDKYESLKQKNVDFGGGVERLAMILQGKQDIYQIDVFKSIIDKISKLSEKKPTKKTNRSFRIIADHLKAATFILGDERDIVPSNVDRGYILRRFLRRAIRHGKLIGIEKEFCSDVAKVVVDLYRKDYPLLEKKKDFIISELKKEENKFRNTLDKGLNMFNKVVSKRKKIISGKTAFLLFQSYGFPLEMTVELAKEKKLKVDEKEFYQAYERHKELSRVGAEKKFKGGLSDHSERTTRMHTATHLLNEALRKVLDQNIVQKGSNITPERLRFDFSFPRKLTIEEIKKVEDELNRVVNLDLKVTRLEMSLEEAKKIGAQSEFGVRYPPRVYVYKIGDYSLEICGGPHVEHTKQVGKFKIIKEESVAAGVRRIKAVVE